MRRRAGRRRRGLPGPCAQMAPPANGEAGAAGDRVGGQDGQAKAGEADGQRGRMRRAGAAASAAGSGASVGGGGEGGGGGAGGEDQDGEECGERVEREAERGARRPKRQCQRGRVVVQQQRDQGEDGGETGQPGGAVADGWARPAAATRRQARPEPARAAMIAVSNVRSGPSTEGRLAEGAGVGAVRVDAVGGGCERRDWRCEIRGAAPEPASASPRSGRRGALGALSVDRTLSYAVGPRERRPAGRAPAGRAARRPASPSRKVTAPDTIVAS